MASISTDITAQLDEIDLPHLYGDRAGWKARIAAVQGEANEAMALLRTAFREGLTHGVWVSSDPDLEPLRNRPDFLELARPKG